MFIKTKSIETNNVFVICFLFIITLTETIELVRFSLMRDREVIKTVKLKYYV